MAAKAALDANFVRQPDATAPVMIAGERVRTHDEIRRRAALAAEGFRQMGLREGDTVALFLRNDFAFFEAMQGAVLAGAYPVAINWHATAEEAGYILRDSDAKVLVVHTDLLPQIVAGLPEDLRILVVDTPAEIRRAYGIKSAPHNGIHRGWDSWLSRFDPIAQPMTAPRGAVIYTSGTTGRPKGVRRAPGESQAALTATAAIGYGLVPGEDRVVLMNGPMYHAAPNSYGTMAFASGADIVLQPRFDAEEMLQLIERYRVTHMHIVPTMFVRLLRLPEDVKGRYDLSCLRYVAHGAAPCPPDIKRAMIEWWGPVIYEYYGATEAGLISISRPEDALAHPGSVGQALPNVSIKVLDESGDEVPAGTIGDIFIHSEPGATFEYIGRENDRRDDKYLTLGDMGFVDEDGFLFLRDRRRDMIISGGVNIYPAEIEATLQGIVGIRDSAVFGIPDDEFGEAICAHVQVDAGGPDAAAIRASLEQQLSRYKVPRYIEIVEDLPREDSGKIFKRKLREPYWANVGRSI
ncbi:acyl-CoA synthetase [Sphingomonas sp. TX0543]|uniref:acyl-CoA synthetase n=1 Tax=Sphingomonas sp. TX0543 TaxID=3399682 RepID=UPI003AFB3289